MSLLPSTYLRHARALRRLLLLPLLGGSAILTGWADEPDADAARVHVEICEKGLNDKDEWPSEPPAASETFSLPAFALDSTPPKYVEDGIRGERPSPSLIRMESQVTIPPGRHRILIRSRSASRLTIDGKVVAENKFAPKSGGDGSQADSERLTPLDLGTGYRFTPGGEYEKIAEFDSAGGASDVRFEAFIGGREGKGARRVELGETVVAISLQGETKWTLLTPRDTEIPYTDAAWEAYHAKVTAELDARSAKQRAALRDQSKAYWEKRRAAAKAWLNSSAETPVPTLPAGFPAQNPVDYFVAAKFVEVKAQSQHASPDAIDFFRDVKPLLDSRCTDCHRGAKAKGGLKLDSRAAALHGGENGAALEPGDAARSEMIRRVKSEDKDELMPPKGARLTAEETATLERWIKEGAAWPEVQMARTEFTTRTDDLAFLRRVYLDTVGVPPTADEARAFLADAAPDKRTKTIDALLADPRWADHWMPMWQDLLAENPNILNPTLNNTGPFRWWLHDSLLDDLPMDQMVTQLVLQRGSNRAGGPAGFSVASQNDSPFAAKGTIVSAAFLGVEMKCARCHDSPSGSARQEQLFQLGALLAASPLDVPKTSSVDPVKLTMGGRKPLIAVTLKPGAKVSPAWPFKEFADSTLAEGLAQNPENAREQLAALLTAPQNERFAQVTVNRIWARFMGRGIVEPLDDWEKGRATHPELLRWLGRELVRNEYRVKPIARIILTTEAYQRKTDPTLRAADPLYTAPEPRRLMAEQTVDSLFAATGKPLRVESVCLDLNGRREVTNSLDLGRPGRAWMLTSLSNERDRPSLMLPRLQAVADVMSALGWRGARQDPTSVRDIAPNALQPAILANGVMSGWVTRLSDDHGLTETALNATSPEALVEELFLRILTRKPTEEEAKRYSAAIAEGFDNRVIPNAKPTAPSHTAPKLVTWTNHLWPESNVAKQEMEVAARKGDAPSARLTTVWRQTCEDLLWALINSPEMLYRP